MIYDITKQSSYRFFWTSWFFFTTGNVFVCGKLDDLCVTCSVAKPETYPEFDSSGRLVAQVIRVRWYVWWSVFFRMKDVLVQSTRHFFHFDDGWMGSIFPKHKKMWLEIGNSFSLPINAFFWIRASRVSSEWSESSNSFSAVGQIPCDLDRRRWKRGLFHLKTTEVSSTPTRLLKKGPSKNGCFQK